MIFKTVFKKGNKYLVKIIGLNPDDEKGTWATTTSAVYNWAKKTYEDGDKVDAEYSVKDGEYTVTRITKAGEGSKKTSSKSDESKGNTCADCGKELKDDKYDKCYICNKKNPSKSSGTGNGKPDYKNGAPYGSLLPEEAERRNKLSILSSACEAVQVLVGQVDVNTLGDAVISLYEKFLKKIKE